MVMPQLRALTASDRGRTRQGSRQGGRASGALKRGFSA